MCTNMGQATAAGQQYARGRRPVHYLGQVHNFRESSPVMAGEDSVDKLLYHNLVGMIPLVESFMLEVVSLQSLVKKSEVNMQASSMKAASLEEEFVELRCQVAALLLLVQSYISGFEEEPRAEARREAPPEVREPPASEGPVVEEPMRSTTYVMPSMMDEMTPSELHNLEEEATASSDLHSLEEEHIEVTRRNYLEALMAAKENPSDEMLALVAELRTELYALVMCPPVMSTDTMKDAMCWQPLGVSIC